MGLLACKCYLHWCYQCDSRYVKEVFTGTITSAKPRCIAMSLGSILELTLDLSVPKSCLMVLTLIITLFHGYLNTRDMGGLTILNQWSVFWSCTGLLVIITALSCLAPHRNASWVFTHYQNQTGFENPGYVLVLGMIGAAYSLFGNILRFLFGICATQDNHTCY